MDVLKDVELRPTGAIQQKYSFGRPQRICGNTRPQAAGHVLTISVQNITELWSEITRMGRYYADHVFDCYECFIQTGFTPVQRMNIPLTWEQFAGFDVKKAKERKRLLGVVCDLLIMKKEIVEYTKRFT